MPSKHNFRYPTIFKKNGTEYFIYIGTGCHHLGKTELLHLKNPKFPSLIYHYYSLISLFIISICLLYEM